MIPCSSAGSVALADTSADPAADEQVAVSTQAAADPVVEGASTDETAIAAAAENFSASAPASAVELTAAASAADGVALQPTSAGLEGGDATGAELVLSEEGASFDIAGESYGLAPADASGEATVVDGAVVHEDVAPSTDVVTRAIEGGVQLAAVLADAAAPDRVDFALDLPQGAELAPNADGTISVVAPVEVVEALPGEEARVEAEVSAILGDVQDVAEITESQQAALDAVAPAATTTTVETQQVATIGAAWAVDANGTAVPTRYEIDGTTLTQVVETDAQTAFPVVADPSWWWWLWTGAACAANLATFVFAAAKLFNFATKLSNLAKRSAALKSAIDKIGGAQNFVRKVYDLARGWAQGNVMKYLTRTQYLAIAGLSSSALNLMKDALGIGDCIALMRAL